MDVIPKPEVESKFPDCVVMKLHLQATSEVPQPSPLIGVDNTKVMTHPKEMDLSLTIAFSGEQEVEVPGGHRLGLPGGKAKFGIRRGQLRLALQNCQLPLEKIALLKPFKVSIVVERQKTQSNEAQAGAASNAPNLSLKATQGMTEKVTEDFFQVKKIGSEDKPVWVFEAYGYRAILDGMLKETLLGVLQIQEHPCEIVADFVVHGDDIELTGGQFGMATNIHRNKLALIERAIALRYIKPMVEAAPICQGRWRHG